MPLGSIFLYIFNFKTGQYLRQWIAGNSIILFLPLELQLQRPEVARQHGDLVGHVGLPRRLDVAPQVVHLHHQWILIHWVCFLTARACNKPTLMIHLWTILKVAQCKVLHLWISTDLVFLSQFHCGLSAFHRILDRIPKISFLPDLVFDI